MRTVLAIVSSCGLLGLAALTGCASSSEPPPLAPAVGVAAVSLDTVESLAAEGGAAQSGTLTLVSRARTSTATFSGEPALVAPASSLSGPLVEPGDGVGAHVAMSGASSGAPAATDGVFSDFALDLVNDGDQPRRFTLRVDVAWDVIASGADSFAYADLSVRDAANVEVYYSEHRADTGEPGNALDAASATDTLQLDLAPGVTARLTALQRLRGGALAAGDYTAELEAFIGLVSVE